jgi:hypothetical protein
MSGNYMDFKDGMNLIHKLNGNYFLIDSFFQRRKTDEQYQRVKDMGLETVEWETFDPQNINLSQMLSSMEEFILKNQPCLFIFDPLKPPLKKGFLFNVTKLKPVEDWVLDNLTILKEYSYLITTQVCNYGTGFVGTLYSNGKGDLLIETYHKPKVSNQREISQPKEDIEKYRETSIVSNFEILSKQKNFLQRTDLEKLIDIYGLKKGYFDFVKGTQANKTGIYTLDHHSLDFPAALHLELSINKRNRLNALLEKNK